MNTSVAGTNNSTVKHHSPKDIITTFKDNDTTKHEDLTIEGGKLKIVGSGEGMGWYSDSQGALLYKNMSGNFMIETEIAIRRKDQKAGLPEGNFSSAGLLIRNPDSSYGKESWLMYNIGFQNRFFGRELKVTRPMNISKEENPSYDAGLHSLSTLYLLPEESVEPMKLRVARIGNELRSFFFKDGKWHEQKPSQGMEVYGNGIGAPVSEFGNGHFRPNKMGLPKTVQAGIMVNPGIDVSNLSAKRDSYALFSYVDITVISNFSDALKN